MEAFDETLDRRIWSLADNRIKWHTLIGERRRKVPTETEKTVTTLLGHLHKIDDEALPALSNAEEETAYEQDGKLLYFQSLFLFIHLRIRCSNKTN
jgi:Kinetochore protein Mis14 like